MRKNTASTIKLWSFHLDDGLRNNKTIGGWRAKSRNLNAEENTKQTEVKGGRRRAGTSLLKIEKPESCNHRKEMGYQSKPISKNHERSDDAVLKMLQLKVLFISHFHHHCCLSPQIQTLGLQFGIKLWKPDIYVQCMCILLWRGQLSCMMSWEIICPLVELTDLG